MKARVGTVAVIFGLALLGGVLGAGPAAAEPIDKGHFHDVFTDFFDCDGTPTQVDGDVSGNFQFIDRGPALFPYFGESTRGTLVFTNLDNGGTFTEIFSVHDKDLKITDNGDGTITILVLATGSDRWYDTNGNLVLNDPGQIRFEVLIDTNGTPGDPSDDEEIAFLGLVKGSTGRNDTQGRDFCADLVTFTT
jgi:hypothetical protein